MRRYDAVLLDLFGTLVYEFPKADWDRWLDTCAAALECDADAFRGAWTATAIQRQTGLAGDMREHVRTLAARAGSWPSDAQVAECLEARAELYRTWFVPRPGAEELLRDLRARGIPSALVSMCAPDTPPMWRASPLAGLVDVEVFSCEVGHRKPDPEIYRAACDRLGVSPDRCLYVGDGSYGELTGAVALGMHAVLVSDPEEEAEMLRPEVEEGWAGPTIADLREVVPMLGG